jgi:hypothetical protein
MSAVAETMLECLQDQFALDVGQGAADQAAGSLLGDSGGMRHRAGVARLVAPCAVGGQNVASVLIAGVSGAGRAVLEADGASRRFRLALLMSIMVAPRTGFRPNLAARCAPRPARFAQLMVSVRLIRADRRALQCMGAACRIFLGSSACKRNRQSRGAGGFAKTRRGWI